MSIENLYKNIFNYDSYTAIAPESEKNMVLRLTNIAPNDISLLFPYEKHKKSKTQFAIFKINQKEKQKLT